MTPDSETGTKPPAQTMRPWQAILGVLFVIGVPMAFFVHLVTGWTL